MPTTRVITVAYKLGKPFGLIGSHRGDKLPPLACEALVSDLHAFRDSLASFSFLLDGFTKALRQIRPQAHDILFKTYQETVTQRHLRIINHATYHSHSRTSIRVIFCFSICYPSNCNTNPTSSSSQSSSSSCMFRSFITDIQKLIPPSVRIWSPQL